MYEYASALQKVGVVGDEATISGMSTLSMYAGSVDQVKKLTPAILDLAVADKGLNTTQATVESYAQRVGYALTGNTTMLKRLVGASNEEIKTLNGMNSKAEKTAYLYELIKNKVGGANEELAQTAEGGIMKSNNALGDMKEKIGSQLVPYLNQFKQILVQALNPAIEWFGNNIGWLAPVLIGFGASLAVIIGVLTVYVTVAGFVKIMNELMGASFMKIALPIMGIVLVIGILIAVLIHLWNTNDEFVNALVTAWDYAKIRNDEGWKCNKSSMVCSTEWSTDCLCRNIINYTRHGKWGNKIN